MEKLLEETTIFNLSAEQNDLHYGEKWEEIQILMSEIISKDNNLSRLDLKESPKKVILTSHKAVQKKKNQIKKSPFEKAQSKKLTDSRVKLQYQAVQQINSQTYRITLQQKIRQNEERFEAIQRKGYQCTLKKLQLALVETKNNYSRGLKLNSIHLFQNKLQNKKEECQNKGRQNNINGVIPWLQALSNNHEVQKTLTKDKMKQNSQLIKQNQSQQNVLVEGFQIEKQTYNSQALSRNMSGNSDISKNDYACRSGIQKLINSNYEHTRNSLQKAHKIDKISRNNQIIRQTLQNKIIKDKNNNKSPHQKLRQNGQQNKYVQTNQYKSSSQYKKQILQLKKTIVRGQSKQNHKRGKNKSEKHNSQSLNEQKAKNNLVLLHSNNFPQPKKDQCQNLRIKGQKSRIKISSHKIEHKLEQIESLNSKQVNLIIKKDNKQHYRTQGSQNKSIRKVYNKNQQKNTLPNPNGKIKKILLSQIINGNIQVNQMLPKLNLNRQYKSNSQCLLNYYRPNKIQQKRRFSTLQQKQNEKDTYKGKNQDNYKKQGNNKQVRSFSNNLLGLNFKQHASLVIPFQISNKNRYNQNTSQYAKKSQYQKRSSNQNYIKEQIQQTANFKKRHATEINLLSKKQNHNNLLQIRKNLDAHKNTSLIKLNLDRNKNKLLIIRK